jgi:uncharacterized membrane protein
LFFQVGGDNLCINTAAFAQLNKVVKNEAKKCHTAGTVLNTNRKIVERVKIDTPNTQIHDL